MRKSYSAPVLIDQGSFTRTTAGFRRFALDGLFGFIF